LESNATMASCRTPMPQCVAGPFRRGQFSGGIGVRLPDMSVFQGLKFSKGDYSAPNGEQRQGMKTNAQPVLEGGVNQPVEEIVYHSEDEHYDQTRFVTVNECQVTL